MMAVPDTVATRPESSRGTRRTGERKRSRELPLKSAEERVGGVFAAGGATLYHARAEECYETWPTPTCIVSDGPYGLNGFPGDPATPDGLADWYEPHAEAWAKYSTPATTLWFWNSEVGWATVHPVLEAKGWRYRACHTWNKGLAHVAGNANSKTLRRLPTVTEVCVQYVRDVLFRVDGYDLSMQEWLRHEWRRTGLPFSSANDACGVRNAASRKYLTPDHLWYYPPPDMFGRMVSFANDRGDPDGKPYFSVDGKCPLSSGEWSMMRAKFRCPVGVTNVWDHPPVSGAARVRIGSKALHLNQKPLALIRQTIEWTTDEGDVIWEPFGGLFTAAVAAVSTQRHCYGAEVLRPYFDAAVRRLQRHGNCHPRP